jgi:hypothetical protein
VTIPSSITILSYEMFTSSPNLTSVYFQGNAPALEADPYLGTVFNDDDAVTVYYLPGTTGWGSTFNCAPAVQLAPTASGQFTYVTNAGSITITGYSGPGGSVIIPSDINGLPVTALGSNAFDFCTNLSFIALSTNMSSIGNDAFDGCTNLASIVIFPGVTNFGNGAFEDCVSLVGILIPNSVTGIGAGALEGCISLSSLTIPAGVTNIGNNAFDSCSNLTSVYFPGNCPTVGPGLFNNDNITAVYYSPCATGWGATLAGLPAVAETLPSQLIYTINAGAITITGYSGTCGDLIIPAAINGLPVTCIYTNAFPGTGGSYTANTNLTSVTIPGSVTSIESYAFDYCTKLTNLSLPTSLTNIGDMVFGGCTSLTSVTIPNGTTLLGYGEFSSSGLTSITIPGSVTSIADAAFIQCYSLTNITIDNGVAQVGAFAFYGDP